MCKGVAVVITKDEVLIGKSNSHSEIKGNCDDSVKINVIYDDRTKKGYRWEIDAEDDVIKTIYFENGYTDKSGKLKRKYKQMLEKTLLENESLIFKVLIKNLQHSYLKGYQRNYSATINGHQDNNSATIKGNQYNDSAKIGGNQYNYSITIKGYQNNDSAIIKGKIYLRYLKNGKKNTQKILDEFSNANLEEHTLESLIHWLIKRGRMKMLTNKERIKISKKANEIREFHIKEISEHLEMTRRLLSSLVIEKKSPNLSELFQISRQMAIICDRIFSLTLNNSIEYEAMEFEKLAQFIKDGKNLHS